MEEGKNERVYNWKCVVLEECETGRVCNRKSAVSEGCKI